MKPPKRSVWSPSTFVSLLCAHLLVALLLAVASPSSASEAGGPPLVLAAASLQESLNAAADAWGRRGHQKPVISFAASSALARQIEAGAPADLFISADEQWMDELQKKGLLAAGSRYDLLGNKLVLIAPSRSHIQLRIERNFPLGRALGEGRLAIADPAAVPAGLYTKAALNNLGVWEQVMKKLAPAENVRAALAFVERGEAPLGIVYQTDAYASPKVRIVGRFPDAAQPSIRYPVARLKSSTSADAEKFRRFLISADGEAIFRHFGFIVR